MNKIKRGTIHWKQIFQEVNQSRSSTSSLDFIHLSLLVDVTSVAFLKVFVGPREFIDDLL